LVLPIEQTIKLSKISQVQELMVRVKGRNQLGLSFLSVEERKVLQQKRNWYLARGITIMMVMILKQRASLWEQKQTKLSQRFQWSQDRANTRAFLVDRCQVQKSEEHKETSTTSHTSRVQVHMTVAITLKKAQSELEQALGIKWTRAIHQDRVLTNSWTSTKEALLFLGLRTERILKSHQDQVPMRPKPMASAKDHVALKLEQVNGLSLTILSSQGRGLTI